MLPLVLPMTGSQPTLRFAGSHMLPAACLPALFSVPQLWGGRALGRVGKAPTEAREDESVWMDLAAL